MKSIFETVDQLQPVLDFHRDRHSVLSGNVANVNTPGYVPFDMTLEHLPPEASITLERTAVGHLDSLEKSSDGRTVFQDDSISPSGDGNAVNLERELSKIDANRLRYGTTTELISRRLALLRYTAGDGQ